MLFYTTALLLQSMLLQSNYTVLMIYNIGNWVRILKCHLKLGQIIIIYFEGEVPLTYYLALLDSVVLLRLKLTTDLLVWLNPNQ